MPKTVTVVGRGHRSRTLLNLLASFFHSPTFWKRSFTWPCYSLCFQFRSCRLILRYIPRQLSRNETRLLQTNNELLLGNLRTNRERVILPSSQKKLRKNTLLIDQSVFTNFALYVINSVNRPDPPEARLLESKGKWLFDIGRSVSPWSWAPHFYSTGFGLKFRSNWSIR